MIIFDTHYRALLHTSHLLLVEGMVQQEQSRQLAGRMNKGVSIRIQPQTWLAGMRE